MKHTIYIICLLLACLSTEQLYADGNIQMNQEIGDPYISHGGRSVDVVPTAFLDGTELTISYPLSTESQVMIIDQSTQSTVYTETFAATRSLNIDLEEEGLPDGSYTLRIYAFGKWWIGEFMLGGDE